MKYPLEKLLEMLDNMELECSLLTDAGSTERNTYTEETPKEEIIKAVKLVYLLRGKKNTAQWAYIHIPHFDINPTKAYKRIESYLVTQTDDTELDDTVNRFLEKRREGKKLVTDTRILYRDIQYFSRIARIMEEAKQRCTEQGIPEIDENEAIKAIKQTYLEMHNVGKVAEWVMENLRGYAGNITQAKERITWILDEEESGDEELDILCNQIRSYGRALALRIHG